MVSSHRTYGFHKSSRHFHPARRFIYHGYQASRLSLVSIIISPLHFHLVTEPNAAPMPDVVVYSANEE